MSKQIRKLLLVDHNPERDSRVIMIEIEGRTHSKQLTQDEYDTILAGCVASVLRGSRDWRLDATAVGR